MPRPSLIEVAERARKTLRQELIVLQDDLACAQNDITVAIKTLLRPLAEQLIDELRQARRRAAIYTAVLTEIISDDPRIAPRFSDNSTRGLWAPEQREAPLAHLKREIDTLRLGSSNEDHRAAVEAAAAIKKVLADLRFNSATPLPKI